MSAMVACTADRGQGATVLSPQSASPAGVRVSVTFSSRRPSRRLFFLPAAPVQNRRRPERRFLKGECSLGDGLRNCSFGMPRLRGLPQASHQLSIGESRGPRATGRVGACAPHSDSSRAACAGTAAVLHRLSPSQSRAALPSKSFPRAHRDPVTQQMCQRGIRLDASPSSR